LNAQNIIVSNSEYSDQELIEDIFLGTNCLENISILGSVSGNLDSNDSSYGYFDGTGTSFPFKEGIVLSTGSLNNVPGPNLTLSDDDAPNWNGDVDLNNIFGINNTINATVLEFSFVPQTDYITFSYIFASEEYFEGNPSVCEFSDVFAFLIRPVGGQYQNIATVPGTNTPVQVSTVNPGVEGECEPENGIFFNQYNSVFSPINFNGQTRVLNAEANVISGQTYEMKLVIADVSNYRYDSAVFIEGESLNVGVDLNEDMVLCSGQSTSIEVDNENAMAIRWYFNNELIDSTESELVVSEDNFGAGSYSVEVDLPGGCTATDTVEINFNGIVLPEDISISTCLDENGIGVYDLFAVNSLIDEEYQILHFYKTLSDASSGENFIENIQNYTSEELNEVIYVRVLYTSNCEAIAPVNLIEQSFPLEQVIFTNCQTDFDGQSFFDVDTVKAKVSQDLGFIMTDIELFYSEEEAFLRVNEIPSGNLDIDIEALPVTIYVRLSNQNECVGVTSVIIQQTEPPQFLNNTSEFLICENDNTTATLNSELLNTEGEVSYLWNTGETTQSIEVSVAGNYDVLVTSTQDFNDEDVSCSNYKEYSVINSSKPSVSVKQIGIEDNNRIIITAEGSGDYEYAVNNSNFTDENVFDITEIENIISVRDKNGCGQENVEFIALRIPDFFTPNGDGFNDYWQIEGIRKSSNDIKSVYIFDRYGKVIFKNSTLLIGWDGTYMGRTMPSQDYWYKIQFQSGQVVSGNFTLKR
jgi:gliding motility-associated-like protein